MTARRDLLVVAGALGAITLAAWAWQLWMALDMAGSAGDELAWQWTLGALAMTFVMWVVMMVAMMLPSALPFMLGYGRLAAARTASMSASAGMVSFVSGYLLSWALFSIGATALQVLMHRGGLLSPQMAITNNGLSAAVLLVAGLYQFTPMKHACARHCRTATGFFIAHWRDGPLGALRMGVRHGLHCVGCCWLLMAIMFVVGVMNIAWMMILAAVMLIEKLPQLGGRVERAVGAIAIAAGGYLVATALFERLA